MIDARSFEPVRSSLRGQQEQCEAVWSAGHGQANSGFTRGDLGEICHEARNQRLVQRATLPPEGDNCANVGGYLQPALARAVGSISRKAGRIDAP